MNTRKRLIAGISSALLALPCLADAQEAAPEAPPLAPEAAAPAVDPDAAAPALTDAQPGRTESEPSTPTDPPAREEPIELSAGELANLGLDVADRSAPALDTTLHFWGFADFTVVSSLGDKSSPWRSIVGRYPSFAVGNFNLYLSKNITERIRTMGEVRFTYSPNGTVSDPRTGERYSTQFSDYATYSQYARWGGVILQRVYVDVTLHELAVLRIGQFLTPYGVWNIDHGSPTVVPVLRPAMLNQALFPESQTGFELFGRRRVGANHALGYHLTLSNGFGPISEYRDLDRNKAVGGRVYWQLEKLGQLQLGGAAFYGRDTTSRDVPGIGSDGKFASTEIIEAQSDVLSLAADLRWTLGGLLLQSEIVSQQRKYTDGGRPGAVNPLLGRWVAPEDVSSWGVYGLAGYRFDWLGVMPYLLIDTFRTRDPRTFTQVATLAIQPGINIRPVDAFVVKLEYAYAVLLEESILPSVPFQRIVGQVAWAF